MTDPEKALISPPQSTVDAASTLAERMLSEREQRAVSATDTPLLAGLRELALFLPHFEDPDLEFGHMAGMERRSDGMFTMAYWVYSPIVGEFIKAAHRLNLVQRDFDWGRWLETPEALGLRDDPTLMECATPEQLSHLLTAAIRQDRIVDGTLASAYELGLLTAILRRAAALTRADSGSG